MVCAKLSLVNFCTVACYIPSPVTAAFRRKHLISKWCWVCKDHNISCTCLSFCRQIGSILSVTVPDDLQPSFCFFYDLSPVPWTQCRHCDCKCPQSENLEVVMKNAQPLFCLLLILFVCYHF